MALNAINLYTDTEQEIRNSVNAGKVVTANEQRINFNGWVGEGYIIIDPETGAGAYKIAGGENGGQMWPGEHFGRMSAGLTWAGMFSEGLGRLLQSNFFFGLGKVVLGPMANMILVVAGMFQVLDSCLQAGAGPLKTLGVMLTMIAVMAVFIALAQVGFVMVGPLNFIAW